jgi:hypothetical protein
MIGGAGPKPNLPGRVLLWLYPNHRPMHRRAILAGRRHKERGVQDMDSYKVYLEQVQFASLFPNPHLLRRFGQVRLGDVGVDLGDTLKPAWSLPSGTQFRPKIAEIFHGLVI